MRKIVKISGHEYSLKSSAWTQFKYKNDTGRGLLSDLMSLSKSTEEDIINNVDGMLDMLLRITYNMIIEANENQVGSYEDFLKGLEESLFDDNQWMGDAITTATFPLSRGIQGASPQE